MSTQTPTRLFWALLVGIILLRLLTLGAYPLLDPTEGRYAEIPREMIQTGNWIVPQLHDGKPFLGKPPLMFWSTAISYEIFGINEFSARLPSFIFTLLTGFLVYLFARSFYGRTYAILTVMVLSTTFLFYLYSGYVAVDPALLVTVTLSMVSLPFALRNPKTRRGKIWGYLFFSGLGLSLLAKGLIGPVVILFPLFVWTLWNRKIGEVLKGLPWVTGSILTLLIAVPWHVMCEVRSPGFLQYYFIGEHLSRFLVSSWEGDMYGDPHNAPPGMIWLFLLAAAAPWSVVLIFHVFPKKQKMKKLNTMLEDPWVSYTFLWLLSAPIIFTFSRNVMITYPLPSLPAFALLTANIFMAPQTGNQEGKWVHRINPKVFATTTALFPILFLIGSFTLIPQLAIKRSQKELGNAFTELDADGDAQLVYTDEMPHSGDFYANGRALEIPDENPSKVLDELKDLDQDYFAIQERDVRKFPVEGLRLTH